MGFKEDADFARYLTMGAHGTAAVAADLNERGHEIIELERYATANKVWSIKVKRLRVPDLLCVRCGRRFESKAKSKLEIKLSHSATPDREWFAGGMRPTDVFAFIKVVVDREATAIGRPYYFSRDALEDALGSVKAGIRKAISAGAEADVSWPAWVPSYDGVFLGSDPDDQRRFLARATSGGSKSYRVPPSWIDAYAYLTDGTSFVGTYDLVAGSVRPADVECESDTWDWIPELTSSDQSDRFAAVKSFRRRDADDARSRDALAKIAGDQSEDWRVRLEAQGALAIHHPDEWVGAIEATASNTDLPPEQQMEAIFLLSELTAPSAARSLELVAHAQEGRPSEVRSAAIWGLGVGAARNPQAVMQFIYDEDDRVALHAASVLPIELPDAIVAELRDWLMTGSERQAAVAATLLARHNRFADLLELTTTGSERGRLYATRALGQTERSVIEDELGSLLSPEIKLRLEPMWTQHTDWMWRSENQGALDVLDAQQVAHDLNPGEDTDSD